MGILSTKIHYFVYFPDFSRLIASLVSALNKIKRRIAFTHQSPKVSASGLSMGASRLPTPARLRASMAVKAAPISRSEGAGRGHGRFMQSGSEHDLRWGHLLSFDMAYWPLSFKMTHWVYYRGY